MRVFPGVSVSRVVDRSRPGWRRWKFPYFGVRVGRRWWFPLGWRRRKVKLEKAHAEIARLRAGEDATPAEPGARLTFGQWIYMWNRFTADQRLVKVEDLFRTSETAERCFTHDHDALRAELDAANQRIRELLDDTHVGLLNRQVLAVWQLAQFWADGAGPELDAEAAVRDVSVFVAWLRAQCGRMVLTELADLGTPVKVRGDAEARAATGAGGDQERSRPEADPQAVDPRWLSDLHAIRSREPGTGVAQPDEDGSDRP